MFLGLETFIQCNVFGIPRSFSVSPIISFADCELKEKSELKYLFSNLDLPQSSMLHKQVTTTKPFQAINQRRFDGSGSGQTVISGDDKNSWGSEQNLPEYDS